MLVGSCIDTTRCFGCPVGAMLWQPVGGKMKELGVACLLRTWTNCANCGYVATVCALALRECLAWLMAPALCV